MVCTNTFITLYLFILNQLHIRHSIALGGQFSMLSISSALIYSYQSSLAKDPVKGAARSTNENDIL